MDSAKETARIDPKTDKERAIVKLCSMFRRLDSAYRYDNPIEVNGDIETYASLGSLLKNFIFHFDPFFSLFVFLKYFICLVFNFLFQAFSKAQKR